MENIRPGLNLLAHVLRCGNRGPTHEDEPRRDSRGELSFWGAATRKSAKFGGNQGMVRFPQQPVSIFICTAKSVSAVVCGT